MFAHCKTKQQHNGKLTRVLTVVCVTARCCRHSCDGIPGAFTAQHSSTMSALAAAGGSLMKTAMAIREEARRERFLDSKQRTIGVRVRRCCSGCCSAVTDCCSVPFCPVSD